MDNREFKTLLELAQSITEKSARIQHGDYGLEELEGALKELRQLQERLIILKYKAMESLSKSSEMEVSVKELEHEEETPSKEFKSQIKDEKFEGNQMTIMDGIKQVEESVNDKLLNPEKSLAEKLEEEIIVDLKKAISLNDKFTFIHQLFNEDQTAYESVIKKIDEAGNKDDAFKTVEHLMKQYKWEEEDQAFQKFKNLISRKFV